MIRIARVLLVILMMTGMMTMPAWAVGTVNQSLAQIPGSTNFVFTENWTADAANGSVPATVISGTISIQGFRIVSVEIAPGSPAPTNNYTVTLTDFSGADMLGGSGASQSSTTASVLPSLSTAPPIYGSLTVNVTGNVVNSAKGAIFVYFAPVSQVIGNTPTGASLTGNNLLTGANTFQGTSSFSGPVNSSGTATFSGNVVSSNFDKVLFMDGNIYPCTTAGLQAILAAVIAAGGGTADARGCPTMTITSQITIGNVGGTVVSLELPVGGVWTITGITDGTSCGFLQFGETRIRSSGPTNNPFVLHAGLATNSLGALYCTATTGTFYYNVENVQFYNPNGAAMANGAFWVRTNAFDNSLWQTVTVSSYGTIGVNITSMCCSATFANLTSNGNSISGSIPLVITNSSLGATFLNASIDHPGTGQPNIKIAGPNSTTNWVGTLYMETNTNDATTPLIQITDAGSGSTFIAQSITSNALTAASTAYVIQNSGTSQIVVGSLQRRGTISGTNGINEVGAGYNVQTNALNNLSYNSEKFQFGPSQTVTTGELKYTNAGGTIDGRVGAGSLGSAGLGVGTFSNNPLEFFADNAIGAAVEFNGTNSNLRVQNFTRSLEGTAPAGIANSSVIYADSTAHNLRVNLNNTGFGPLVTAAPCTTSQRTESAADANLLTCAIPAQAGSYRIRFVLSLSAANAATLGWTATWTDSNGAAQTPTNLALINDTIAGANGSATPALTFTTSSVSDYHGDIDIDVNNAGTSIVVKLTFSGTSFTGKASATVERII